jgi:hypothetical protein
MVAPMIRTSNASVLALIVLGAACNDKPAPERASMDYSSIAALRDTHRKDIEAICRPALEAGSNVTTALAEDKVAGVRALTKDNAAILTEAGAGMLRFSMAKDRKGPEYLAPGLLRDTPSFVPLCLWGLHPDVGPIPFSFGLVDGRRQTVDETRDAVEAALAWLQPVEYVVLIRVVAYDADHVAADARIIDRNGAALGGFRFEATGSEKELADNARKAFAPALAAQVPGSTLEMLD